MDGVQWNERRIVLHGWSGKQPTFIVKNNSFLRGMRWLDYKSNNLISIEIQNTLSNVVTLSI
jgi:hypothetical protein